MLAMSEINLASHDHSRAQTSEQDRFLGTQLSPHFFVTCVVAFALLLFAWKAMIVLGDPSFRGDASVRMLNAGRLIARMGNRVWLPYLQMQIWALARFHVPYSFFNLIPCAYLFIAAVGLGLMGLRILGRNRRGLLISLAAMFCFAQQRVIAQSSTSLYQEITATALFYVLLCGGALELARRRWMLVLGAVMAVEKNMPWGRRLSAPLGVALLAWAGAVVVANGWGWPALS